MIVAVAILVAIVGLVLIGIGFGRSVERARAQDAMAQLQAANDAERREYGEAMASVSQLLVEARDEEIRKLKEELELERRARVRDISEPAGWGDDPATTPEPTS